MTNHTITNYGSTFTFNNTGTRTTVGFGTAGLGNRGYEVLIDALKAGFRRFDTAEESDYWYDQDAVGSALQSFFVEEQLNESNKRTDEEENCIMTAYDISLVEDDVDDIYLEASQQNDNDRKSLPCSTPKSICPSNLSVSTKIPPWELTSTSNIRNRAKRSRQILLGFCDHVQSSPTGNQINRVPLDIYYIHAPTCWDGWHTRCHPSRKPSILPLRESWKAMEQIVSQDGSAKRIGLSNISPEELKDIIHFVKVRLERGDIHPHRPRLPDVVQAYADPIYTNRALRKICEQHGIEFVSYSTLGTQHRGGNGNPVLNHDTVLRLSNKHERSVAEVVLNWALARNMSVIPRSSNHHHIRQLANMINGEDVAYFLEEEDIVAMDALSLN